MKVSLIVVFALFYIKASCQRETDFNILINKINHYLDNYSKLSGFSSDQKYSISDFGFSNQEISELNKNSDNGIINDSIDNYEIINYLQKKIIDKIHQITSHPDFQKNDIQKLIPSGELSIVASEDSKLFNFSIDEKTGGTYRSRLSVMYFADFIPKDTTEMKEFQEFFSSDGYTGIYSLSSAEGTKYVLTGFTRFCSLCFGSKVRLVSFKGNHFEEEFEYSVESRDWNGGVSYDNETKTINVDYHIDDLTTFCECNRNGDYSDLYQDNKSVVDYNCICKFIFNGKNFQLAKETLKKTLNKEKDIHEVLSFKIKENQKEVRVLIYENKLYYVFLKPNGEIEFSYPVKIVDDAVDFKLNQKKDRLTFNSGNVVYQIYILGENSKPDNIGIVVTVNGKRYDLKGDVNTLKGTLENINNYEADNLTKE